MYSKPMYKIEQKIFFNPLESKLFLWIAFRISTQWQYSRVYIIRQRFNRYLGYPSAQFKNHLFFNLLGIQKTLVSSDQNTSRKESCIVKKQIRNNGV